MSELVHGPVPEWEPLEEDKATIDRLLNSESEIDNAYAEAYQLGLFVKEFAGETEEQGITAVGELNKISLLNFRTGKEVEVSGLTITDCFNLDAYPGRGITRPERVRDGIRGAIELRDR